MLRAFLSFLERHLLAAVVAGVVGALIYTLLSVLLGAATTYPLASFIGGTIGWLIGSALYEFLVR
jgi:uncharacterized membrane protein YeaQ/YmgE (transglycosylase-associated protein family)